MSGEAGDTPYQFFQFVDAFKAHYVTRDGNLVIDDPEIRRRLIRAIDAYTAIYRKGLHATRFANVGRLRQQRGLSEKGGSHDAKQHALDPQR
jgi:hypothetical protein